MLSKVLFLLTITFCIIMLSTIMLSFIMLSVVMLGGLSRVLLS
jgi:hypothetical protein